MATLAARGGFAKQMGSALGTAFNGIIKGAEQNARSRQRFRGARRLAKTSGRNRRRSNRPRRGGRRRNTRYQATSAPRTKGFTRSFQNRRPFRFAGTDAAAQLTKPKTDVTGTADDPVNSNVVNVPLSPSIASMTPRLATTAALFQHAGFNDYVVEYTPQVPTDISGTVYMGFVADPQSAQTVNSYLDIMMLPVHYYGPVWQPAMLHVSRNLLNKQVPEILLKDEQETDITDPLQCQGMVVYCLVGLPTDMQEDSVVGNLAVKYDVSFRDTSYKPDATTVGVQSFRQGATAVSEHPFSDGVASWNLDELILDRMLEVEPITNPVNADLFTLKHARAVRVTLYCVNKSAGATDVPVYEIRSDTHRVQVLHAIGDAAEGAQGTQSLIDVVVHGRNPSFYVNCANAGATATALTWQLEIMTCRQDFNTLIE